MRRRLRHVIWMVAAMVIGAGCQTEDYSKKTSEVVDVPKSYREKEVEGESLEGWCTDFGDPTLKKLVDRVYRDNLSLRAAWARLRGARARVKQAAARRWPQITAEGQVQRSAFPNLPERLPVDNTSYQTSVAASYEVDLWGRMANLHQAARLDRKAVRADVESMAMSLTSRVAETWYNLVRDRANVDLLKRQIETSRRFLELTESQFARGARSALDVSQQRRQLESLKSQLAQAKAQREIAAQQLAVLLGEPPQSDVGGDRRELPELPPRPDPGVPSELLKNRPDIRAARARIEAADKRILAAVKNQYPSIKLSASLFTQAQNIEDLFNELFWQGMVSASQAVFDGGKRFADIEEAKSQGARALYNYGQTVLEALQDVQRSLVRQKRQADALEHLRSELKSAERSLELARQRYRHGAASYLRVLSSLQSLQSVQRQMLDARRQQISNRIQLCRAVGGKWTRDLESPNEEG
ncbi:MAG: efflux transporter outer membrane subunit [Bradymonadaceae bacterium]